MFNELFTLTRPLIVFDCETTGVDRQKDRIIELGFQRWEAAGLTKEWRSYINPGMPIPEVSIKAHHITDEMIAACRECKRSASEHPVMIEGIACDVFKPVPTFAQLAPSLAKGFSGCDFAGKNVRFDIEIAAAEFTRANVPWSILGARIICADRLEAIAVPRTLTDLYRKYKGEDLLDAHEALTDVRATTDVICAQLQRYEKLPKDLDRLHTLQFPGMIDLGGKFKFVDGVACFGQWGKHAGKPMTIADAGYWNFIIEKDFSAEAKAIAVEAKAGKFPVQR